MVGTISIHHCVAPRWGLSNCRIIDSVFEGVRTWHCRHWGPCETCEKTWVFYPKPICTTCLGVAKATENEQRKAVEAERQRIALQKPTKDELDHQRKNAKTLEKEAAKAKRIKARKNALAQSEERVGMPEAPTTEQAVDESRIMGDLELLVFEGEE